VNENLQKTVDHNGIAFCILFIYDLSKSDKK